MLVWGSVRWFNIAKGYGFVDADDGAGDILLNKRELLAFGAFTAPEGARILVRVEVTARGRHATDQGVQSGASRRRLPSIERRTPGSSSASRSQRRQVTCLCIWSRPSQ